METNSVTPASSYTHTEQSLAQDLSLKQISKIFIDNWLLFTCLFVIFSAVATFLYITKVPYVAQSTIIVNDAHKRIGRIKPELAVLTSSFAGVLGKIV